MQLMTKRCSALVLKNEMKQLLSENTSPFLLEDSGKVSDIQTTKAHSTHTTLPHSRKASGYVSEFQLEENIKDVTFGEVLENIRPQPLKFGKENISHKKINRKELGTSGSSQRLRIERDDQHKLKIVKLNSSMNRKKVNYDKSQKKVEIDVEGIFDESVFTPERIEEIFERAVADIVQRIKQEHVKQPKQFRGDSFSGSVQIIKR